jgi:hypothetical protein
VYVIRWILWGVFVIAWTVALELPVPKAEHMPAGEFIVSNKQLIGKTLHGLVYAAMAAWAGLLPMPARYRFVMMFFLMTHAWGTEMLQYSLDWGRTGTLFDVGLDIAGIAVGVAATWRRWTTSDPNPPSREGSNELDTNIYSGPPPQGRKA